MVKETKMVISITKEYTMKYYLALKRKEILTYATTWMNPDGMSCEINKTKKYAVGFLLSEAPREVRFIEMESRTEVARGWRRGQGI